MDKIDKFLAKLNATESLKVLRAIDNILSRKTTDYDVKKLKGYQNVYRVRIGSIRILYTQLENDIEVIDLGHRNEKTYRDY